jgi:hypothetical protein
MPRPVERTFAKSLFGDSASEHPVVDTVAVTFEGGAHHPT